MALRPSDREDRPRGGANLAALLTWLLPGAGHVLMGRATFGVIAFALVEGLYLLGYRLTDGMLFEVLQPELRSTFAPALTPEAGNLGAILWHMQRDPFGSVPYFPRPWPSTMVLGMTLTALSGIANLVLCVHAWSEGAFGRRQRQRGHSPALIVALTFLLPGLGHLVVGRRSRGVAVFLAIVGLLVVGTLLASGANLDRTMHFYYASGQFLAGGPALVLQVLFGGGRVRGELPYLDAGLVFGCTAGLLNVLAMLDAFTCAELQLTAPTGSSADDAAGAQGTGAPGPGTQRVGA